MRNEYIVQRYVNDTLQFSNINGLKKKSKFQVRSYVLVIAHENHIKSYFYNDGYCRLLSEKQAPSSVPEKGVIFMETPNEKTGYGPKRANRGH